jgi:DNA-binding transcriptional ArsR family regulator
MDDASNWTGDVNEAATEEWRDETTPFERVETVLRSTTSLQYAGEIADRAHVSEPSARKHLATLAEAGLATTEETGRGTRFSRSSESVALARIREIHAELSREELVTGIKDLKAEIRSFETKHDATDPDDLVLELDADDEGWTDVSAWRAVEENLDIAQAALSLYDFDPSSGAGSESTTRSGSSSRGAFADDDRESQTA